MSIIITKNGKNATKIEKSSFKNEAFLQEYIHENPESIPLYEIDDDIKLLILAREFPTNSGPIDAFGIDKNGEIYIIETKLFKNPDKRLVVAQMLDYGSALSFYDKDFSEFLRQLEKKVIEHFSTNLQDKVIEFFELSGEHFDDIIEKIKNNLEKGQFRFVVLMDNIDQKLKNLINFLNQNSRFDIYGVELEFYKNDSFEIMIPKLFGAEVKKHLNISSPKIRRTWNEKDFIEQIKDKVKTDADKIIEIYNYFKKISNNLNWGTGNTNGSFSPLFYKLSKTISPITIYSNGNIYVKFHWLFDDKNTDVYKLYDKFIKKIKDNTDIVIPDNYLTKEFTIKGKDVIANYENMFLIFKNIFENVD